jgi:hypothetical protein
MQSQAAYRALQELLRETLGEWREPRKWPKLIVQPLPLSEVRLLRRSWITDYLGPMSAVVAGLLCAVPTLIYCLGKTGYEEHTRIGAVIAETILLVASALFLLWLLCRERRLKVSFRTPLK